jgi:DNA adenine methylase
MEGDYTAHTKRVTKVNCYSLTTTGRFSPLRYPGGKGKVARFVASVIRANGLSDGTYVEPYAGGAAVAWELLLTGVVRRVEVNDISRPIYAFWHSVLNDTDALSRMISDTPVDTEAWAKAKHIFNRPDEHDDLQLGFAMFFLNRTNRSGILNGGMIGGRNQTGKWKIDARFTKPDLLEKIARIANHRSRITLTNRDAIELMQARREAWKTRTLVYLDPPYYVKGGQLYYDAYSHADHASVAGQVTALKGVRWMVSYDDAPQIHNLYAGANWLRYSIGYSARDHGIGSEAVFFSPLLKVPALEGSMVEVGRSPELETFAN